MKYLNQQDLSNRADSYAYWAALTK